jgi:hypothetical protein
MHPDAGWQGSCTSLPTTPRGAPPGITTTHADKGTGHEGGRREPCTPTMAAVLPSRRKAARSAAYGLCTHSHHHPSDTMLCASDIRTQTASSSTSTTSSSCLQQTALHTVQATMPPRGGYPNNEYRPPAILPVRNWLCNHAARQHCFGDTAHLTPKSDTGCDVWSVWGECWVPGGRTPPTRWSSR